MRKTVRNWAIRAAMPVFTVLLLLNGVAIQAQNDPTTTTPTQSPPLTVAPTTLPTEPLLLTDTPISIDPPTATLNSTDIPVTSDTQTSVPSPTGELSPTITPTLTEMPVEAPALTEQPFMETDTPVLTATQAATGTPTATATLPATAFPTQFPEPPMQLLANETFDNGDLSPWQLGTGWALVASDDGLAMQVVDSEAALRYIKGQFFNAAVQARFLMPTGLARLSLRQSSAGNYTAVLDASGAVQLLRAGIAVGIAVAPPNTASPWRTLRLSAVGNMVRVSVDGIEVIAVPDNAPLLPGEILISASFPAGTTTGQMQVDDFALWVPQDEYGSYPSPTPVEPILEAPTADPPTLAPTADIPTLMPSVEPKAETPSLTPGPALTPQEDTTTLSEETTAEAIADTENELLLSTAEATQPVSAANKTGAVIMPLGEIQLPQFEATGNDDFANAVAIQAVYPHNASFGDTTAATRETDEPLPSGCGYDVGQTVWFSFTPTTSGDYVVSLAGSNFDTVVGVYTGTAINDLAMIACNDDVTPQDLSSQVTLNNLTGGTIYYIQIGGHLQDNGLYSIKIEQPGLPAASKPRQLQPSSGATLVDQTPAFFWNPADGAVAYEFQMASDRQFTNLVIDPLPTPADSTFTPAGDLAPGVYYWRVRGLNANGDAGQYSNTVMLTIRTVPPDQRSPNMDQVVSAVQPTFVFTPYGAGATYTIRLSDSGDFDSDVDHTFECNRTRCTLSDFSLHQGEWYWQVRANDVVNNPTAYSDSRKFTVSLPRAPLAEAVFTTNTTGTVTFRWFPAKDATGYTLQIDDDPTFASPDNYPTAGNASSLRVTGLSHGTYSWRILVTTLDDSSPDQVPTRNFVISPPALSPPTLLSPNNRATTASPNPTLDWEDVPGTGITYNVQVCSRSNCRPDSAIIESTNNLTESAFTLTMPLTPGVNGRSAAYYWRVQTVNTLGVGGRFALRTLYVRTAPPNLISPRHESSTTDTTPTLSWSAWPGATYDLEIATDETFNNIIVADTGLAARRYTPTAPLAEGSYYWRIRAVDGTIDAGMTAYSLPYKFTVGPRPPVRPRLFSPAHNSTIADQTPTFSWNDSPNAATYCILVDDNARFSDPEIDLCALSSSEFTPASPLNAGRYYWKVRPVNALGGIGAYSQTWRVTIQTDGPSPRYPADTAVITDTTPTLTWASYPKAVLYNIRIDDSATCDSPLDSYTSTRARVVLPMLNQGLYYWCVQATDYLDNGESLTTFGPAHSFTIDLLTRPADDAVTTDTTPTFRWAAAGAGLQYCLDVDSDPDFDADGSLLYSECTLTTTSHTPTDVFTHGIYYWRVRVSSDGGSTYSPAMPPYRTLTISPRAPSRPGLTLPRHGATIWTTTPVLTWKPSTSGDPVNYTVEIDDTFRFTSPEFTETLPAASCTATACTISIGTPLASGATYYWRVWATNQYGVDSPFSPTFRFNVIDPMPPSLISPATGMTTTNTRPIFRWRNVRGTATFDIRLDTSNPPVNTPGVDLTRALFRPADALLETTYYWQVQAYDSIGTPSGWSEIHVLKIVSPNNSSPLLHRFGPGSTDAPHTVHLTWGPVSWTNPGGWYEVMVDNDSDFSSPVYASPQDASVLPTGTQQISEIANGLPTLANGLYYWRVRACDNTGQCGNWSHVGHIVVDR